MYRLLVFSKCTNSIQSTRKWGASTICTIITLQFTINSTYKVPKSPLNSKFKSKTPTNSPHKKIFTEKSNHTFNINFNVVQAATMMVDYEGVGRVHWPRTIEWNLGSWCISADLNNYRTARYGHFIKWYVDDVIAGLGWHKGNCESKRN